MEWVLAAIAVLVLGLAALAAAGQLGSMPAADDDVYRPELPAGDITASQLRTTRFGVAIRGYDMKQVDALLDRLANQLEPAAPVVPVAASYTDEGPSAAQLAAAASYTDEGPSAAQLAAADEVLTDAAPGATSGLGMPVLAADGATATADIDAVPVTTWAGAGAAAPNVHTALDRDEDDLPGMPARVEHPGVDSIASDDSAYAPVRDAE